MYKGIIKKVPSEKQFEMHENGECEICDLKLFDTITEKTINNQSEMVLPIRLSYQDLDNNGNGKYVYDGSADVYIKAYRQTPILYATGKELRILVEYGEYAPVKIVVTEIEYDGKTINKIECVQNQHAGLM